MLYVLSLLLVVILVVAGIILAGSTLYSVISMFDVWSLKYANRSAADLRYV